MRNGEAKLITCKGTISQIGSKRSTGKKRGRKPRVRNKSPYFTKEQFVVHWLRGLPDTMIARKLNVKRLDVERMRKQFRLTANRGPKEWWKWQGKHEPLTLKKQRGGTKLL